MSAREEYAKLQVQLKELKAKAAKEMNVAFGEASKEIFAKHPTLKAFSWSQYTDYFNDGDTCLFHVHNDNVDLLNAEGDWENSEDFEDGKSYDYFLTGTDTRSPYIAGKTQYKQYNNGNPPDPLQQAAEDITTFLKTFDEDDFMSIWGDHVKVAVNSDCTIETEEYIDHD